MKCSKFCAYAMCIVVINKKNKLFPILTSSCKPKVSTQRMFNTDQMSTVKDFKVNCEP